MREITTHHVNPCNRQLQVFTDDVLAPGGASTVYSIEWANPSGEDCNLKMLRFQDGPVTEAGEGVNGITHEALLSIMIDRLEGFQAGKYACPENAKVLDHLRAALDWLATRTERRDKQGIEGTMQVDQR